uniref:Mannose receptor, C type 1b n=1 Tax=Myripristis murdjan TaxID=586833 RepID=A0A667X6X6_9TELE
MLTMWISMAAFVLLVQTSQCLASDDSPFMLTNKDTGFCLMKKPTCLEVRWTTSDRLFVPSKARCVGVGGESEGSEVNLFECDEKSALQKWECKNETMLVLKDKELYINIKAEDSVVISKETGPNSQIIISGTSRGACSRTSRVLYTIEGNANGKPCMFPFNYKDKWYSDCTTADISTKRAWCGVETRYDNELWGYCPTTSTEHWMNNPASGTFYQINTQSALTWPEAQTSCKQQNASLLSVTDPIEMAYISGTVPYAKLWIGLVVDEERGWHWADGKPFRYLRWDTGHPLTTPGQICALLDSGEQFYWQSSSCYKKLGYICYQGGMLPPPVQVETGFCSDHWIPYNGHCFHLNRDKKTWSQALTECRKDGGELARVDNVEDKSFFISQIGYATDELWIGLNDKKTEGLFDWSDHSTVTFTSWESGEPTASADQEDCVLMKGENANWSDRRCEEKHGFICMKKSDSKPSGDETPQDEGCKPGWKRHGSYCYLIGSETKTFDEAKQDCESSASYLADVSTGVDNAYLVSLVGLRPEKHFWLGLSNQKNIDEFVWTNTKSVKFTHWNAEMPGNQQGCVAMTTGVFAGLWDVLPCTNKEKYICKHQAEGTHPTPVPPTPAPLKCPDGWTRLTSKKCFKVRPQEKTWYDAKNYCKTIGGDLLSIHSTSEEEAVRRYRVNAWIGLSDPSTGYVWSDGSPLNFQHWQSGEPNNYNNVESCAEIVSTRWEQQGFWNDLHCEKYLDWLCQIRAGNTLKPPPNDTVPDYNTTADGWIEWRGNQYYINENFMAMEDARHFCIQRHGDLAVINSEAENLFLWKQISRSYGDFYIGISVDLDGTFGWMDKSLTVFEKWDQDEPDFKNNDENCGVMTSSLGFWRDLNCGRSHKSICKRIGSLHPNTTAPPTAPPAGGCPPGWSKFDTKCYLFVTDKKDTWFGARKQCQSMGQKTNLVSILSSREQVYLVTQMAKATTTDLWIGMNTLRDDGFYWTDGRPRKYINLWFNVSRNNVVVKVILYAKLLFLIFNIMHFVHFSCGCFAMNTNPDFGIGKWLMRSCNDTNGFVCYRDIEDPTNFVKLVNDTIKIVTQNLTWDEASENCKNEAAKLANLRTGWIQAYVHLQALNVKAPLWIGLNKNKTDGYFKYIDGWRLDFTNWYPGEPSRDRSCVYVDVDGTWKTAFCNQTMNSVCMQSKDMPPQESNEYPGECPEDVDGRYGDQTYTWRPFKSHCYVFIADESEWQDASVSCIRHGGNLASIEDTEEQKFIQDSLKTFEESHNSFWIGLYKTHAGSWLWLDQNVLDYTNWDILEPDDDSYGEIMSRNGKWRTGARWYDRAYICKTAKGETIRPLQSECVLLVIAITAVLAGVAFYFYKKSGRPLPAFDNPLYKDSERSQPDVVDTSKLIENVEEENPEPIITL